MDDIIEVKNLTKRYGDFTAVDDISFDIEKGEIFAFHRSERRWQDDDDQDAHDTPGAHERRDIA